MAKRNTKTESISIDDLQRGDFIRVRVPNVLVNGEVRSVKFVARQKHVTCKARGLDSIKVRPADKGFTAEVMCVGGETFKAKTPAQAFAKAANTWWA